MRLFLPRYCVLSSSVFTNIVATLLQTKFIDIIMIYISNKYYVYYMNNNMLHV